MKELFDIALKRGNYIHEDDIIDQPDDRRMPETCNSQSNMISACTIYDNYLEELKVKRWKDKQDKQLNAEVILPSNENSIANWLVI